MFSFIRAMLLIVLVVIVVAAAAAFFAGYRVGDGGPGERGATGTSGGATRDSARETGAAIGGKIGDLAGQAQDALSDGAITAKIKSKMALDDSIKARDIHVSTTDGVVTLSGKVNSTAERDRALQLARETEGVKSVTDQLQIAKSEK